MMKNVVFVIILVTCFACAGQNEDKENKSVSPVREDIEWLDVWMPHTNDTLLLGYCISGIRLPVNIILPCVRN